MASDPSIYNTIGRPQSFVEAARSYGALRGDEQQRQMNALLMRQRQSEMDATEASRAQANALLNFERDTVANLPADQVPDAYQRAGYISQAETLRAKRAGVAKDTAEASRATTQDQALKRTYLLQGLNGMTDRDAVKQHLASGVQRQVFGMQEAKSLMDAVPVDPAQFQQWRDSLVMGPDKAQDNAREAAAQAETSRRNQELERLRALELERPRADRAASTQIVEGADGFRLVDKETGQARPVVGADGAPVLGKRGQAIAQKAQDANLLANLAAEAEPLIAEATGSYMGAGVDAAGRLVGASTSGAEAIAKLRVIQGRMLALTERMEGPQSNYDVQIYQQAVGNLSDPTVPAPQKAAALETIRGLQERYFGRGAPAMPPPSAQPARLTRMPLVPASAAQSQQATPRDPAASAALFNAADAILRGGR
jgi:hypothetical protein